MEPTENEFDSLMLEKLQISQRFAEVSLRSFTKDTKSGEGLRAVGGSEGYLRRAQDPTRSHLLGEHSLCFTGGETKPFSSALAATLVGGLS
jgi:hypothetical protein